MVTNLNFTKFGQIFTVYNFLNKVAAVMKA